MGEINSIILELLDQRRLEIPSNSQCMTAKYLLGIGIKLPRLPR